MSARWRVQSDGDGRPPALVYDTDKRRSVILRSDAECWPEHWDALVALVADQSATSDPYDRSVLAQVLIYHQRADISSCTCGWSVLGASHPEHVADIYEMSMSAALVDVPDQPNPDGDDDG